MSRTDNHTSLGGVQRRFPTTEWTRILDPAQREAVFTELFTKYWKPLYHYLRCKGFSNDKAKDLVQGFFTEKVLGQELVQKADKTKGKFRNFLLIAIKNYAINAQKKHKVVQELDEKAIGATEITDPETNFNRAWADDLLREVLSELETESHKKGKTIHWQVFREWLVEPDVEKDQNYMSNICTKYGIANASQAYNMISNIKKRFRAILRSHLRSLVNSDAEVDAEISEFISIFSRNPTRY